MCCHLVDRIATTPCLSSLRPMTALENVHRKHSLLVKRPGQMAQPCDLRSHIDLGVLQIQMQHLSLQEHTLAMRSSHEHRRKTVCNEGEAGPPCSHTASAYKRPVSHSLPCFLGVLPGASQTDKSPLMGPELEEVVFLYTLPGTRSFRMTGCRSEDTAFTECAPNPRRTGKPHCYTGLPNDCDCPQKVRKITQDSNFDVRS